MATFKAFHTPTAEDYRDMVLEFEKEISELKKTNVALVNVIRELLGRQPLRGGCELTGLSTDVDSPTIIKENK